MDIIYYTREEIERAREMDLLTYLRLYEPENLVHVGALHEFLWDSYLKLSLIFNWNAPSDPRCEDFFAGIVLAAIERASLG